MEGVSKGQAVGIVRDVLVREEFEWVSQQTHDNQNGDQHCSAAFN